MELDYEAEKKRERLGTDIWLINETNIIELTNEVRHGYAGWRGIPRNIVTHSWNGTYLFFESVTDILKAGSPESLAKARRSF